MTATHRNTWLDLVRGGSAIAVCAGHLRAVLLSDYESLKAPTVGLDILYFATGLGHQAVMVFFVLSGFFVGGSIIKSRDAFIPARYATDRLTRLWIVLIPAMIITIGVDQIIMAHAPEVLHGAYNSTWHLGPQGLSDYSSSFTTFIGNVFFQQSIVVPTFGTDSQLWSLANEFWYYALFPFIFVAVGRIAPYRNASVRILCGLIAVAIFLYIPLGMSVAFLIWLLGVGAYLISQRLTTRSRPLWLLGTLSLFLLSLIYSRSEQLQGVLRLPSDFTVGLGFAPLCIVLATMSRPGRALAGRTTTWVSDAVSKTSYSLYCIHLPFVIMLGVLVYGGHKLTPDAVGLAQYFGWLAATLLLGTAFWFLFERHTNRVRRLVTPLLVRQTKSKVMTEASDNT